MPKAATLGRCRQCADLRSARSSHGRGCVFPACGPGHDERDETSIDSAQNVAPSWPVFSASKRSIGPSHRLRCGVRPESPNA